MTHRLRHHVSLAVLALALFGCANGYSQFYRPATGATPEAIASTRSGPPPAVPLVERSQPVSGDIVLRAYEKRGYTMIGSSMFNAGGAVSESGAIAQAKTVGADLVLILDPRYTGSVTSSVPITVPTSTTSYSTGTATAFGPGGPVTAYGSGTTTTYGTSTSYVPVTVNRSDYGAVYFVKARIRLGAYWRDLNDAERRELQSNKGVVIRSIVDDSPAFQADILVGDIVISIDGIEVSGARSVNDLLRDRSGKMIELVILRGGQRINKQVQLNAV
jgi:membrane-associated protease RseP (regulator of RpoE activity)